MNSDQFEQLLERALACRKAASDKSDPNAKDSAMEALKYADELLGQPAEMGEIVGILIEFTPLAIAAGDLPRASQYTKRLARFSQQYKMPLWNQLACIFYGRIALAEDRSDDAVRYLTELTELLVKDPNHLITSARTTCFLVELKQSGHQQEVREFLDAMRGIAKNSDDRDKIDAFRKELEI